MGDIIILRAPLGIHCCNQDWCPCYILHEILHECSLFSRHPNPYPSPTELDILITAGSIIVTVITVVGLTAALVVILLCLARHKWRKKTSVSVHESVTQDGGRCYNTADHHAPRSCPHHMLPNWNACSKDWSAQFQADIYAVIPCCVHYYFLIPNLAHYTRLNSGLYCLYSTHPMPRFNIHYIQCILYPVAHVVREVLCRPSCLLLVFCVCECSVRELHSH